MKYCSVGSFCQSAEILRSLGLREFSGPFDWMYINIDIIKHCLEDDFKSFLDKSNYQQIEKPMTHNDSICGHSLYSPLIDYKYETVPGAFFVHEDLTVNDEAYESYSRRIDRFRELIKSDEKLVLLYMYKNREPENSEKALIEALLFTPFLDKYVKNYRLILIYHSIGEQNHSLIKGHNLDFVNLSASFSEGNKFREDADDIYVNQIVKKLIDDIR